MKKLILFLGLLFSFTFMVDSLVTAYAADPGINQGGGNENPDWGWNSIDSETKEI